MPILPATRQNARTLRRGTRSRDEAERSLLHAFATFTQAAGSRRKFPCAMRVGDPRVVSSTILLCHSLARFHLRRLLKPSLPRVVIIAPAEILPGVAVQSLEAIR